MSNELIEALAGLRTLHMGMLITGLPVLQSELETTHRNAINTIDKAIAALSAKEPVKPEPEQLSLPDDGAYLIRYDDKSQHDELFVSVGAKAAAMGRYAQISPSWNAHLFVKIDSNCRDQKIPNATVEPAKPEPRVIPKDRQWCGACKGLGTVATDAEPAKLPDVDEFIDAHKDTEESGFGWWLAITETSFRAYIAKLTAAHAAELAKRDSTIIKFLNSECTCTPTETGRHYPGCPIAVKEQGRREALEFVPWESIDKAACSLEDDACSTAYPDLADELMEHVRAARQFAESARAQQEITK